MRHQLSEEYVERLASFEVTHPTAYAFMKTLEVEGPSHGIWLSTDVNAHLYKEDAFLAYLKLKNPELKPPCLVVSPAFNQKIAAHTSDQSERLFPKQFDKVVMSHGGFKAKWATRLSKGITELTVATPKAFFDELYSTIASL